MTVASRFFTALTLLLFAACATAARDITPALQGQWGGQHIGMTVGTLDTDVQFDCAAGSIIGPYWVERDGTFEWTGEFTRGTGGPVRQGQQPSPLNATYFGVFRGGYLRISVRLDDGEVIGPFMLQRFKEPQIFRCL